MRSMGCKSDEEERREFFDTRTPDDPAYYSPKILDLHDYHTGEMLTNRGKEIMKRLRGRLARVLAQLDQGHADAPRRLDRLQHWQQLASPVRLVS